MMREKKKIIYLDETCFTKRSIQTATYSAPYQNIKLQERDIYSTPVYVIAAISKEKGVELV